MHYKFITYVILTFQPLSELAYVFDSTFFKPICLTAKVLRRQAMRNFLVGATEPKKRILKSIQLRFTG